MKAELTQEEIRDLIEREFKARLHPHGVGPISIEYTNGTYKARANIKFMQADDLTITDEMMREIAGHR